MSTNIDRFGSNKVKSSFSDKEENAYLTYIHNFRGVAILFIVAFHCLSSFGWGQNYFEKNIFDSIFTYGTILFMFISGYLFHYLNCKLKGKSFDFGNYLKKKYYMLSFHT